MSPARPGVLRSVHRRESGTIILLAAVTIVVIVGMLALAVDLGYLMSGKGQLQNALDATALAAVQGTHAAIEPPGIHIQQNTLVRSIARDYAKMNRVRRIDSAGGFTLDDSDISVDYPPNYPVNTPQVTIRHQLEMPVIFANIFGFSSLPIGAVSVAGASYVDGGTGMISGCWRPILMPDTFTDKDGNSWAICGITNVPFLDGRYSPARPAALLSPGNPNGLALEQGDTYVSRFASITGASDRNATRNFIQQYPDGQPFVSVNGLRDASSAADTTYSNKFYQGTLMGQRMLVRPSDYRILNFGSSGVSGYVPQTLSAQLRSGCCVPIRVGQLVQVYAATSDNDSIYQTFYADLQSFFTELIIDNPVPDASQYRYTQSSRFRTPNSSPRTIPVLMCSPIQFSISKNTNQFYVTNIAAFTLENVLPDGTLIGYFAREVVTGGTPLESKNEVSNRGFLPISPNLVR